MMLDLNRYVATMASLQSVYVNERDHAIVLHLCSFFVSLVRGPGHDASLVLFKTG